MYLPLLRSSFLYTALSFCLVSFHFTLLDSLSFRAGLVVMKPLSFCLPRNVLISLLLLKDSFVEYSILCWFFFLLVLWRYWPIAFWPPKFLMRNLLIISLSTPFMGWFASLSLLSRFFLFLLFKNLIICVLVWVSLNLSYLEFTELLGCWYLCLSSNLGSFQPLFP